jgi:hypothetical protein
MISTVAMVLLTFISWTGLEARDTPSTTHTLLGLIGRMWTVLRFPVFTFFWNFIVSSNSPIITSLGIFLNSAFYGIIVERIFYLFHKKRKILPTGLIP